ncbi:MAG: glycoside hydrolase family 113, partial [Bradymonadia bacterium]
MLSHLMLTGLLFASSGFHGATLSFYGEHVHDSGTYEARLKHLAGVGAQSVSFVVFWSLKDIHDDGVRASDAELALEPVLIRSIRQARALGLTVMLMPVIRLEAMRDGEWRGKLSPRRPNRFWQSYRSFVVHYATIAQREGVSLFSVGSELSSLEHQELQWRKIIRAVRRVYRGYVTYSANWDHFQQVPFWDALDFIGISAYFELTENRQATENELVRSWRNIRLV